jgi:hypothetical protein
MIIGGVHQVTPFYNNDPVNSIEFFPPKDGGIPRPSGFLERTLPANLFPRYVWIRIRIKNLVINPLSLSSGLWGFQMAGFS